MKYKEFDVNYWESNWETVTLPQEIKKNEIHEIHQILSGILPVGNLNIIEIGCSPAAWLIYFHKNFHYNISGIEYAPKAYQKAMDNLKLQSIKGELFLIDFRKFDHKPYDIVFSNGFIEHFEDVGSIIEKLKNLSSSNGGLVVTVIPTMEGINWFISRKFRPKVASGHYPLSRKDMISLHELYGLQTIYCDYIGAFHFSIPIEKNKFSIEHPHLSALLNMPFRFWNKIVDIITLKFKIYPKLRLFGLTKSIIYIGRRED